MRIPKRVALIGIIAIALFSSGAAAQTETNLSALRLLAPISVLRNGEAGRAALARNQAITRRIRRGSARQPTLLPFRRQREQALRDAFTTSGNAYQLADGLGSKLRGVYQASLCYTSATDGETSSFTNISPSIARLIAYAVATTGSDSGSGKYFFANATLNGKKPVSAEARKVLEEDKGIVDVYGKAYGLAGGGSGADLYGNSRPFQTEPGRVAFSGKDYFGARSANYAYLTGPTNNLIDSPSYPSGHTTYGYTEGLLLAVLVPERYPQMVARAAEYGNDRIILGAHYAMDVLAGRTLATFDLAQLLANSPGYVKRTRAGVKIDDFRAAVTAARTDLTKALEEGCRETIAACARRDRSRFARTARDRIFYEATQTYGLPVVWQSTAKGTEDVGKRAREAGYLLTAAFPYLTLEQADAILTETEGPGGGFLDDGSRLGVYSRLDLFRAAQKAIALGLAK